MNGELSKQMIDDAVLLISNYIGDVLIESGSISIDNFGTLHTYVLKGHIGQNVSTGDMQYVRSKKNVMFAPHVTFSSMLDEKRNRFKTK
jgi:nucleoid DNA-binding protein